MADNLEDEPILALESLDDYIRRRGILPNNDHDRSGEFNGLTRNEAARRISQEKNYLDSVILKHLDDDGEYGEASKTYDASLSDYQQSDADDEAEILVLLANDATHNARVKPLVSLCETVRRAVISRSRFGVKSCENSEEKSNEEVMGKNYILELSLVEFDPTAVIQFLRAVGSLFQCNAYSFESSGTDSDCTPTIASRKRRVSAEKHQSLHTQHILHLIDNNMISDEHIVECLRISHYLQCSIMLEVLASVLESSIDSHNCMSICSLADVYSLQSLFEASVNHVVGRLDALQGPKNKDSDVEVNDEEELSEEERLQQEIWKSLPHELRSRILTMRNVMRSSVIGRGSKVSGVFFSSGDEFLAIFSETLSDMRERLAEARERRTEVIREREEEWKIRRQRRGRWFDSSEEAKRAFIYSGDVDYALGKIQKQEERIKTLETFYEEQKLIFRNSSFGESGVTL